MPSTDIHSLEHEDSRLRGAVYFGYGLMNIIMSLIPPKLMKLANLFGFHGNRRLGLQALEFASNSQDMKAPLARCGGRRGRERGVEGEREREDREGGRERERGEAKVMPFMTLQDWLAVVSHYHSSVLCS